MELLHQKLIKEQSGLGLKLAGQGRPKGSKNKVKSQVEGKRLVKGSVEAKEHMAKLRAMRKKK